MSRILHSLRHNQALHQAFVALSAHEVIDAILYGVLFFGIKYFNFGLGALAIVWVISFITGLWLGHRAIELHDKLDRDEHREMSQVKEEPWLWD